MSNSLIIGNWKMNGSLAFNQTLLQPLSLMTLPANTDVGLCVPYVYLAQLQETLKDSAIDIGAQDISIHEKGAYTGEISASMLQEFSCKYVITGHSERRRHHNETNALVAQKAKAALTQGLCPIICMGETLEQREAGLALTIIEAQLAAVKEVLNAQELAQSVIAYEPSWAIGTGLTATPEQAQTVHAFIRQQLGEYRDSIRIIYGGSINKDNAEALFAEADINGGLIGGASLKPSEFSAIIKHAH